jgi:hypothetical protein
MKGIVTLRNSDGSYDSVGMNNRTITSNLKTTQGVRTQAFNFAKLSKSTAVKIEFYMADRLYGLPFSIEEWERVGALNAWQQVKKLARTK